MTIQKQLDNNNAQIKCIEMQNFNIYPLNNLLAMLKVCFYYNILDELQKEFLHVV